MRQRRSELRRDADVAFPPRTSAWWSNAGTRLRSVGLRRAEVGLSLQMVHREADGAQPSDRVEGTFHQWWSALEKKAKRTPPVSLLRSMRLITVCSSILAPAGVGDKGRRSASSCSVVRQRGRRKGSVSAPSRGALVAGAELQRLVEHPAPEARRRRVAAHREEAAVDERPARAAQAGPRGQL